MENNSTKNITCRSVLSKIMSVIFALGGIFAIVCFIYICLNFRDASPTLTFDAELPKARVTGFMESVCNNDFASAENYLLNHPDLGIDKDPKDEVSKLIWDAFLDSMEYSFSGDCYATNDGIAQNITFTCLDITSVTTNLRERSQAMLKARVEAAVDTSEIYDENNEYRADLVNEILHQAVKDALAEDAQYKTTVITINLKRQDDQWWIQADQTLLDTLFCDVLFYS